MSRIARFVCLLCLALAPAANAADVLSPEYGRTTDAGPRPQLRQSPLRPAAEEPRPAVAVRLPSARDAHGESPRPLPSGASPSSALEDGNAPAAAYGARVTAALEPANLPLVTGADVVRERVAAAENTAAPQREAHAVHRAEHQAPLAISPRSAQSTATDVATTRVVSPVGPLSSWGSLSSVMASLGLVLGLFFFVAWLMRRGMPGAIPTLPKGVIEVLGRAPLPGRQQMQLLRVGRKLILVHMSLTGAETLTEIEDPAEVDRIAGMCQQGYPQSSTRVFQEVLDTFGREHRAGADFLDQDHGLELVSSSARRGRGQRV
jgi:flagellar protein FliO/FliZ